MDKQELLELQDDITEAKEKVSELRGSKKHLMQELEEKWDCPDLEAAHQKLEELDADIVELDEEIDEQVHEIEEHYHVE